MKLSLILTVAIFAAFAWFQWTKTGEVLDLDEAKRALEVEASMAGLDPVAAAEGNLVRLEGSNATSGANGSSSPEPDSRVAREKEVREFVQELVGFARDMEAARESGKEPDAGMRERILDVMNRFLSLGEDDLTVFVDELKKQDISPRMRGELIGGSLMMVAQKSPETSLRLLDEAGDLIGEVRQAEQLRLMCVTSLASSDPAKAIAWLERQEAEAPDRITSQLRDSVVAAMAGKDPAAAWKFAARSENVAEMAARIGMGIQSDAGRDAGLEAMRAHLKENPADAEKITRAFLGGLGGNLAQADFAAASGWLENANLDDASKEAVVDGILGPVARNQPGPWIDWMQNNLPEERVGEKLKHLIPAWTRTDFNAVGSWLNTQPAGEIRDRATQSFAATLAPHEPEAAAVWATTLPESPERWDLLNEIHRAWKEKDSAAAEAFAAEHGISP